MNLKEKAEYLAKKFKGKQVKHKAWEYSIFTPNGKTEEGLISNTWKVHGTTCYSSFRDPFEDYIAITEHTKLDDFYEVFQNSTPSNCQHKNKYLNKFSTFSFFYCPDCKSEVN